MTTAMELRDNSDNSAGSEQDAAVADVLRKLTLVWDRVRTAPGGHAAEFAN